MLPSAKLRTSEHKRSFTKEKALNKRTDTEILTLLSLAVKGKKTIKSQNTLRKKQNQLHRVKK